VPRGLGQQVRCCRQPFAWPYKIIVTEQKADPDFIIKMQLFISSNPRKIFTEYGILWKLIIAVMLLGIYWPIGSLVPGRCEDARGNGTATEKVMADRF